MRYFAAAPSRSWNNFMELTIFEFEGTFRQTLKCNTDWISRNKQPFNYLPTLFLAWVHFHFERKEHMADGHHEAIPVHPMLALHDARLSSFFHGLQLIAIHLYCEYEHIKPAFNKWHRIFVKSFPRHQRVSKVKRHKSVPITKRKWTKQKIDLIESEERNCQFLMATVQCFLDMHSTLPHTCFDDQFNSGCQSQFWVLLFVLKSACGAKVI